MKSGTFQNAGGIGEMLALSDSPSSHYSYSSDASGNITALLDSRNTLVASYSYDPYGNTLSAHGPKAALNLYRFSSKEQHPNRGTYYFTYRFYDSGLQRWLNRDPIQESGGENLFAIVRNAPVRLADPFGLRFVYKGEYKDGYQRLIDCWKKHLPENSLLRRVITTLESSPRDIRINRNTARDSHGNPARPHSRPDSFDRGSGHDTATYINPGIYSYDGRTWTFPQALAHELLHAYDYQSPNPAIQRRGDTSDYGWWDDEAIVTREAKEAPCH